MNKLPQSFLERLSQIIPSGSLTSVVGTFSRPNTYSYRVNTLKARAEDIVRTFKEAGIEYTQMRWSENAFTIPQGHRENAELTKLMQQGILYKQSLSSMLPPLILNSESGEHVLDLCAAPGSKTTQMAAMMENKGIIVAIENVRDRFFKLQSILKQADVKNVETQLLDGRRYRGQLPFEKILLDAPCSSEGRFKTDEPESYSYWSPRKIKEMVQKQKGLLLNASRLLKTGGTLVYSTCTFAPEENESVIDWLLKKTEGSLKIVPISLDGIMTYPAVMQWENKKFSKAVAHCCRILPTENMEGFFITKLVKG